MTSDRLDRIQQLFLDARKQPPAVRQLFLHANCDDEAIVTEVFSLLAHDTTEPDALDRGVALPAELADSLAFAAAPPLPASIGNYRVISLLGQGGFGTVYLAEQTEPVRRRVAIKLLSTAVQSDALWSRFEAERQTLAMMEHAGIATLFDAGTTPDDGCPFFVMEYVNGEPITQFCESNGLAIEQRLRMFIDVCQAVQHAHNKGIIHRDLKPDNILVVSNEGQSHPKVIDFGIAKAMGDPLLEMDAATREGQIMGSLDYMSPEQISGSIAEIDTRSDVYALGAILYELLTGHTPFDKTALRRKGLLEAQKQICEQDPPRPSERVIAPPPGKSGATSLNTDSRSSASLHRQLRRDLDWIVLKCLAKSPNQRYQSAHEVADDLQRYLDNKPVHAAAPTITYQFGKFCRRHRAAVFAAVAIAVVLIASSIVSSLLMLRALKAESVAEHRLGEVEEANRAAEQRAEEAIAAESLTAQVSMLFVESFQLEPWRDGYTVSVAEVMERAAKRVDDLTGNDLIRGYLKSMIGHACHFSGMHEEAITLLAEGADLLEKQPDDGASETALAARLLALASRYHRGDRLSLAKELETMLAELEADLGPDHDFTLEAQMLLGLVYNTEDIGRRLDSMRLLEEVVEKRRQRYDEHTWEVLEPRTHLLRAHCKTMPMTAVSEAESLVADLTVAFGAMDARTIDVRLLLMTAYQLDGKLDKAVETADKNWRLAEASLGRNHPTTMLLRLQKGNLVFLQDRAAEAIELMEPALVALERDWGLLQQNVVMGMVSLAAAYEKRGNRERAIELLEYVARGIDGAGGLTELQTSWSAGRALWALAGHYEQAGRHGDAVRRLEQVLEAFKMLYGSNSNFVVRVTDQLSRNRRMMR